MKVETIDFRVEAYLTYGRLIEKEVNVSSWVTNLVQDVEKKSMGKMVLILGINGYKELKTMMLR